MPLFRKRRSEPTVIGPDGTEYVAVDEDVAHDIAVMLSERALANLEREVAPWVRTLLFGAYDVVVRGMRGEAAGDTPTEPVSFAATAAKLGYEARDAEFAFLEKDSSNTVLSDFLTHVVRSPDSGQTYISG